MSSVKPRLAISFSGGRSSAVMTRLCLQHYAETHEILITFSDTGCEHENTLQFVHDVDRHWCNNQVEWIEAVINEKGVGVTAKQVDFQTASRRGEPFEAFIAKYGIPCMSHPQCTSRLKEDPMYWWRKYKGWKKHTYDTAIGIRADEMDRVSSKRKEKRFIYPLVDFGFTKDMVRSYMAEFEWDLKLPSEAYGNCTWCWKKSFRKLYTLAQANPEIFDFPLRMEKLYTESGRKFFRKHTTTEELLEQSFLLDYTPYSDNDIENFYNFDEAFDVGSGCGESCEIGADE